MITRSGTPICGAARPAPSSASIVSSMSVSKLSSSGEPNCSTSRERTSKRGSPSLSTGLIAIADLQMSQHAAYLQHGLFEHLADIRQDDSPSAGSTSCSPIHDDCQRRIRDLELARQYRLRHSRHPDHIGAV